MESLYKFPNEGDDIMKRSQSFIAACIAVVFITNVLNAQWELRYPDIPADQINDILFLNSSTGFIINSAGSILMTTDGGSTWKIKAHYQRNTFSKINFLDNQNGFAISP